MKPTALIEFVIAWITGSCTVQYPKQCKLCGTKTRGNIITGFYLPCDRNPNHY